MSDQFLNTLDPATAHVLAQAALARRREAYQRKKASGTATAADDVEFATAEVAEQNRILAYQTGSNMDYMQNPFVFPSPAQQQFFYPQVGFPNYVGPHQQQYDDFYVPYGAADYADLVATGMIPDDFGDSQEISTRPRLTKEQADVLEAQFQANHKPSSQVKRELAIQTNLKLTRVGNWFQNRRAKAKQQKRQEEYEAHKAATATRTDAKDSEEAKESPESKEPTNSDASKSETASPVRSPARSLLSPRKDSSTNTDSTAQTSPSPVKTTDNSKEASWYSLQRALGQAKAAQAQQLAQPNPIVSPLHLPPQAVTMQLPLRMHGHQASASTSRIAVWPSQHAAAVPYPSPITLQDNSFDFGFDDDVVGANSTQDSAIIDHNTMDFVQDSFVVTPEDWQEPLATPKGLAHEQGGAFASPGLNMPSYPGSRRQSTTEDLSTNFGNFALAGSSPGVKATRRASESIPPPPSGPLDIAARRKRPRPAALTSASLRSRSYGALTSVSPTFRQSAISPQANHTIRHVKSAGQGLNSRYAGIRKVSSAQRSPMCATSFADAQAFNQLMAQQAMAARSLAELPAPMLSPDIVSNCRMSEPEKNPFYAGHIDLSGQYGVPAAQNISVTGASPPITPMAADYMNRGQSQQTLVPPTSAPAQYASFPSDYTPPYSAGPLTNSSWSDAPLTSPEMPSFPPVTYVPALGFSQAGEGLSGPFQQYVLASDTKSDVDYDSHLEAKRTEFYIQEFPNQKEEHAHVAQQLAQQRPKNYVFANTAPQDYTGP